ncbi:hypothetical protein Pcinc_036754 [Petrolisthes cinctipes]|uniref:Uncharacterized protein n=1 Tax=Petrolisthes cinctipes TaxID=88211 RepID=A0AAE1EM17_PETCI|nr:hypothetical protein Pcinc_036754 [Petrolisthes cinctipes]
MSELLVEKMRVVWMSELMVGKMRVVWWLCGWWCGGGVDVRAHGEDESGVVVVWVVVWMSELMLSKPKPKLVKHDTEDPNLLLLVYMDDQNHS